MVQTWLVIKAATINLLAMERKSITNYYDHRLILLVIFFVFNISINI